MKFSTESQRQLAKLVLQATASNPEGVSAHSIVDAARREEVYKRAGSASNQLREMVEDENFPVIRRGDQLLRTDIEGVRA